MSYWAQRSIHKFKVFLKFFGFFANAQNDKSAVITRFANSKRAFVRHYQAKHKNTSNRHCEQGISLAWQSTNSKTKPFQTLALWQNETQSISKSYFATKQNPTYAFCKKAPKFQGFTPWNFKWADLNLATKTKVASWARRTKILFWVSCVMGGVARALKLCFCENLA